MDTTTVAERSAPSVTDAVVLHVDTASSHEAAVAWAARQAAAEHKPLVLVVTVPTAPGTAYGLAHERAAGQTFVDRVAEDVRLARPGLDVRTHVTVGDPVGRLVDLTASASLLVIGAHPHGLAALVKSWGVDAVVAARSACPLVVVPRHRPTVRRGVLVGVDLLEHSEEVLDFAFHQASVHGLPLTVLSCSGPEEHDSVVRRLAEVCAGYAERHPDVHVTRLVRDGRPTPELVHAAEDMHLLVVGRHRPAPLVEGARGHVRTGVVDRVSCPVAVVPVSS